MRAVVFNDILMAPIDVVQSDDGWANLWVRDPIAPVAAFDNPIAYQNGRRLLSMKRPAKELFRDQLKWLEYWSSLRAERMSEILLETGNILTPMASVVDLNPARRPYTIELLATFYRTVTQVEMRFKNAMAARRPVEFSAQVQPMIQTPGHSSYPSGHATETFSFAFLLATLADFRSHAGPGTDGSAETAEQLAAHAYRTTQNRVVAGVHFPVDNAAGCQLGLRVALYLVERFQKAAGETPTNPVPSAALDVSFAAYEDFDYQPYWDPDWFSATRAAPAAGSGAAPVDRHPDAMLGELWKRARAEWKPRDES